MPKDFDRALPLFDHARPPVMLLGGINLVRTLGMAGIPAIVASSDPTDPAMDSRHCKAYLPLPSGDDRGVLDVLMAAGRRLSDQCGRRVPLMFGSDDALEMVSRYRTRLERHYLFLINDASVGQGLIAKDRFQAFAQARGLPAPRALSLDGEGPESLAGARGAVLVKPRVKYDWHNTELCARLFDGDGKARIFASGAEALAFPGIRLMADQLQFQEYIPGGDAELWSYHGFADDTGEVLAGFVGRKVRTFPTLTGESAFIELAHNAPLEELGRAIAKRCPLKGAFKMDFKRDPRDGSWNLLEVNARFNLWHYLGARNGVNLMRAAYDYLVDGVAPVPVRPGTRFRWLNLMLDFRAYRELRDRGELTFARWARSILASRNIYSLFAWDDPAPWLRFWTRRITRKLARPASRLSSRLRPWRSTAS